MRLRTPLVVGAALSVFAMLITLLSSTTPAQAAITGCPSSISVEQGGAKTGVVDVNSDQVVWMSLDNRGSGFSAGYADDEWTNPGTGAWKFRFRVSAGATATGASQASTVAVSRSSALPCTRRARQSAVAGAKGIMYPEMGHADYVGRLGSTYVDDLDAFLRESLGIDGSEVPGSADTDTGS